MNNKEYIVHTHLDTSITTIVGFLTSTNSIVDYYENVTFDSLNLTAATGNILNTQEFLDYSGGNSVLQSNYDRIYSAYNAEDKQTYLSAYTAGTGLTKLEFGTVLYLPKNKVRLEPFAIQGVNQIELVRDFPAFYAQNLVDLIKDEEYRPINKETRASGSEATIQDFPEVTVWIWSKAFPDRLINVSPFVITCDISSTPTIGNFDIEVAPITGIINENGEWQLDDNTIWGADGYVSHSNITREIKLGSSGDTKSVRSKYIFHHIISENDLVFVRFETLEMEAADRLSTKNKFFIDLNNLSSTVDQKKIYDMIGLVDQTVIGVQAESSNVSVNITGRDLTKLIIDDGVYFYPTEFIGSKVRAQANDGLISRMITDKGFVLQTFAGAKQTLPYMIQFVMNYLSNVEIVPDGVFDSYGDRVVKTYKLKNEGLDKEVSNAELSPAKGIWKIIKVVVDQNIATRRLADSGFSQEEGSLITYFNKICQKPLVEFFTDTYEDMFFIIIRKPPFDQASIQKYLKGELSSTSAPVDVGYSANDETRAIDPNAFSTSDQGKDIIGREIEVVGDARRESNEAVISIDDFNVIDETLQFEDEGYYNVFQIEPQEIVLGQGSSISSIYLPMITITELVKVYGARRLKVISNYMTHSETAGSKGKYSVSYLYDQALNDLKYLIDTNVYLPFTRKGVITINGDRRIKKNTFIRYRPTGEIFYVNGITHSASISESSVDRTTTLQVSRGMREAYISEDTNPFGVSYFNIVNTDLIVSKLSDRYSGVEEDQNTTAEMVTSADEYVLDFFYKGRQFID